MAAAQYNLGVMCAEGRGVEQSDDTAKYWFRKAAELGSEMAQSNLDVLNENSGQADDGTAGAGAGGD
ncbi:MAG TPA: SEL1-like repeat protein [Alphaproteobacteria bacterium]|nr:SEL1-like repeat protein [Alphaproteobacteria bacterium]HJM50819.1 SEL1-like repeat protein [Alphaproteobacteria bacterium]